MQQVRVTLPTVYMAVTPESHFSRRVRSQLDEGVGDGK